MDNDDLKQSYYWPVKAVFSIVKLLEIFTGNFCGIQKAINFEICGKKYKFFSTLLTFSETTLRPVVNTEI